MLQAKRLSPKKIAVYLIVLVILAGSTLVVLYKNLAGGGSALPISENQTSNQSPTAAAGKTGDELNFIAGEKFKKLRSSIERAEPGETGNKNPFLTPSQK